MERPAIPRHGSPGAMPSAIEPREAGVDLVRRVNRWMVAGAASAAGFLSLVAALAFLAVHILASVLDPFAPIRLIDAVVPFVSAYRPVWLGLGAIASNLLIAVAFTSVPRQAVGRPSSGSVTGTLPARPVARRERREGAEG